MSPDMIVTTLGTLDNGTADVPAVLSRIVEKSFLHGKSHNHLVKILFPNKLNQTEYQIQALEAAKEEAEVHGEIGSPHPGFLDAQDTCYIIYIKGIGWLYQQTGIRHPRQYRFYQGLYRQDLSYCWRFI